MRPETGTTTTRATGRAVRLVAALSVLLPAGLSTPATADFLVLKAGSASPGAEVPRSDPAAPLPSAVTQTPTPTPTAASPAPAPAAPSWFGSVTLNAFVSFAYSYNFNRPASGLNQLRVFDFDDNSFKLDVAEVVLQKPAVERGDAGFRVDATAGGSIPRVTAADGLFRDPETKKAQDFDLQQAFVSWIAPVGRGLRLDLGKFVTYLGSESIEGYDGYNDNYSRSFLFGYAIPFTHTGVKATYPFSEAVSVMAIVTNGWDNVKDNNRQKSVGGQLALTPSPAVSLYLNALTGTETAAGTRTVYDLGLVLKPSTVVTVMVNADHGTEADALGPGRDALWWGVAAYLRLQIATAFAVCLRGERFVDRDGSRTGTPQRLEELTLTPELKIGKGLVVRSELRVDSSDQEVFERGTAMTDRQVTVALNVLYVF